MLAYPFAGAGATNTDALYAIGTADALLHVLAKPTKTAGETLCYLMNADDATNIRLGIRYTDDKPFIEIGAATYVSSAAISVSPWGRVVDLWAMLDRSGSCYFYADGVACGSIDISADVGTDIDSDTIEIGGRLVATEGWSGVVMQAHEHVLAGTFPTADERAAIAMQRFLNPDAESPVLAARAAYATERRLDVDFVDTLYGATTVVNHGTGGDLTIGGGLKIQDARTIAERVAQPLPSRNWYTLNPATSGSTGAHDFGFHASNPVIARMLTGQFHDMPTVAGPGIEAATSGDRIRHRVDGSARRIQSKASRTPVNMYLDPDQKARGGDIWVVCNGTVHDYYIDGQRVFTDNTFGVDLNLSGNCTLTLDGRRECCRMAVWQMSSVPASLEQEIMDCCMDPERDPPSLTGKIVDFPLCDGILTGATVANQGTGGGTLTLTSATDIRVMLRGL